VTCDCDVFHAALTTASNVATVLATTPTQREEVQEP
jgi:hypothetical protein